MSTNISTFQDVFLRAAAAFERWVDRFAEEFSEAAVIDEMRATLSGLTPEQHQTLRAQDPDAYDTVMKMIYKKGG